MDLFGKIIHYSKAKGAGKKCSICGEYKALKYFSHDFRRPDTFRTTCKDCDKLSQRESRRKIQYVEVEYKQCSECGKVKAISEFGLDKTKTDGHRSYCLCCMRAQQRHRRHCELLKTTREL